MKVFARDSRVVSIDADLASTSGLEAGVASVDQKRALNVGVAEANMMLMGEAFAALGHNTWISTFCPFFDWKVLRRIAVGQQERIEAIEAPDWLAERGTWPGLDVPGHRRQLRDPHQRRHPHGQRRHHHLRCRRAAQDRRRLLPAADALHHEVDHGGQQRTELRARHASPVRRFFTMPITPSNSARAPSCARRRRHAAVIISSGRGVHEALATAEECGEAGFRSASSTCHPSTTMLC